MFGPRISYIVRPCAEAVIHNGGTYVCMKVPRFLPERKSDVSSLGWRCIGMTNLPAKLAREQRWPTLAMATDYDCWKDEENVSCGSSDSCTAVQCAVGT